MYAPPTGLLANGSLTEWYLPNGLAINNADAKLLLGGDPAPNTVLTTQAVYNAAHTLMFHNLTTMLVAMSSLSAPPPEDISGYSEWGTVRVHAHECALYLCIKQFDSTSVNGTISQEEKVAAEDRTAGSWQWTDEDPERYNWPAPQTELFNGTFWSPRTDLQIAGGDNIASLTPLASANVTQNAIDSLIFWLNQTFQAEHLSYYLPQFNSVTGIIITDTQAENSKEEVSYLYDPPSMQGLWSRAKPSQLEPRFEALATSMTNSMRTAGNDLIAGEEGRPTTVLAVQWVWLSLPLACVVLGAVFLLIAIVETKRTRTPIWKADATALLFHSLEKVPSSDVWDMSRLTQMEKVAEETVVRLADTNGKGFFLGEWSLNEKHLEVSFLDRYLTSEQNLSQLEWLWVRYQRQRW